jgi:hypothetical protein
VANQPVHGVPTMGDFNLDTDAEIKTGDDAKRVIAQLRQAYKEQGAELAHNKAAIADLTKAVALGRQEAAEAQSRANVTPITDAALSGFIGQNKKGAPVVRMVGGSTAEGDWQPGLLDVQTDNGWVKGLQVLAEQKAYVKAFTKDGDTSKTDAAIKRHLANAPAPLAKIFTDSSAVGGEWIPDVTAPVLYETLKAERRVAALFPEYPMGDKNTILPFLDTGLRPYLKGQPATDDPGQYTASSLTTAARTLAATGFAVRTLIDEDADEDAIISAQGAIRAQLAAALVDAEEDAILNADTAASHQDAIASWNIRGRWGSTGLGGASDHRKAWIGLRARAFDVSNTVDKNSAQTYAGILAIRATLDSPMGLGSDCVLITSPEWYISKILGMSEFATLEKFGPQAAVLTGEVGRIGNMPVVISEFMDKNLATSGLYVQSSDATTGALICNRKRFMVGRRRSMAIEFQKDISRGVIESVASVRELFFTIDSSTKKNVAYGFNLTY